MGAKVMIIEENEACREQLRAALARENLTGCDVLAPGEKNNEGVYLWLGSNPPAGLKIAGNDVFEKPVRLGAVLDRVKRHLAQGSLKKAHEQIMVGSFSLDVVSNELLREDERPVRLTDKEKQILLLLTDADRGVITRETLLEKVWGYAQGLETHTLETHIYRLRQKIERDPAKPEILLTDGAGYRIK